ncbi:MAG TPA: condensation domain-containing protein, partial [Blastocatellia bacterium]
MVQKMVGGFRLSPQQERLWTLAQGDAGSAYRSQCAVLIEGQLDIELLKEALKQVTARNQILRTSFHLLPEMTIPLQVISEATPAGSVALDSIGRIACWQEAQIKALFEEIRKRPLDTQQIGRMQLSIASLNAREHLLIISLPAMHTDAAGLKNLVREIGQVYADLAHRPGEANEPVQYNVVSEWLNDLLESEDAEAGRQFWRTMDLSSLQDLKIGCEKQPGQHAAFDPQLTSSVLPAALTASIDSLVEDQGVSEFDFALACWSILLHKISGKAD